ncbi:MAG: acyl-CoA thioesterase [Proteobacteria bacterium]|nr:MAG: acyl-CoA thioesterase [Pseudomonadota bacterium]
MNIDPTEHRRDRYVMSMSIPTRWNDYDMLGHVNNVLYNRYVEITVLELVKRAGVNWMTDRVVPFAAEVCVMFLRPLNFSEHIDSMLRVGRLGTSSVVYEVALYMPDDESPSAVAHFVHVFVDRDTERPVPMPAAVRDVFERHMALAEPAR